MNTKRETKIATKEKYHHLLTCPNCNFFVAAKDINISKTIAKCENCNHVFSFEDDFDFREGRPEMLIPEGMEVLNLRSELDIEVKWTKSIQPMMVVFTLVWNLFLLPFVIGGIMAGQAQILLFAGAHIAVGLGLLYNIFAQLFNRTNISVTDKRIEINTRPFPTPGKSKIELDADDLDQLYVTKYVSSTTNGVPSYAYALYAIDKNGTKFILIKGLNKESQLYIEQEIERYLQIKDRPIQGSIKA